MKLAAVVFAIIVLTGCAVARSDTFVGEEKPHAMTCATVITSINGVIRRCENVEVTCYEALSNGGGIWCRWNEPAP